MERPTQIPAGTGAVRKYEVAGFKNKKASSRSWPVSCTEKWKIPGLGEQPDNIGN